MLFEIPPQLAKLASTPVLASELPAGFTHVKVTRLAANSRYHTLGGIRIDFSNPNTSESASYALMKTPAAAAAFARFEAKLSTAGLFQVRAVAVGRFAVAVTARTRAQASALLGLALAHLRRGT